MDDTYNDLSYSGSFGTQNVAPPVAYAYSTPVAAAPTPFSPSVPSYQPPMSPGFQQVLDTNWAPSPDPSLFTRTLTPSELQISSLSGIEGPIVPLAISPDGSGFSVERGGDFSFDPSTRTLTRLAPPAGAYGTIPGVPQPYLKPGQPAPVATPAASTLSPPAGAYGTIPGVPQPYLKPGQPAPVATPAASTLSPPAGAYGTIPGVPQPYLKPGQVQAETAASVDAVTDAPAPAPAPAPTPEELVKALSLEARFKGYTDAQLQKTIDNFRGSTTMTINGKPVAPQYNAPMSIAYNLAARNEIRSRSSNANGTGAGYADAPDITVSESDASVSAQPVAPAAVTAPVSDKLGAAGTVGEGPAKDTPVKAAVAPAAAPAAAPAVTAASTAGGTANNFTNKVAAAAPSLFGGSAAEKSAVAPVSTKLGVAGTSGEGYVEDTDTSSSADFNPPGSFKDTPVKVGGPYKPYSSDFADTSGDTAVKFAPLGDLTFKTRSGEAIATKDLNEGGLWSVDSKGNPGEPVSREQLSKLPAGASYLKISSGDALLMKTSGGQVKATNFSDIQTREGVTRYTVMSLGVSPEARSRGVSGAQALKGALENPQGRVSVPALGADGKPVPNGHYQASIDPGGQEVLHLSTADDPNAYVVTGGMRDTKQMWVEPKDEVSFWKSPAAAPIATAAAGLFGVMATFIMSEKNRQQAAKLAREDRNMQLEMLAMQYAARGGGDGSGGGSSVTGGNII